MSEPLATLIYAVVIFVIAIMAYVLIDKAGVPSPAGWALKILVMIVGLVLLLGLIVPGLGWR